MILLLLVLLCLSTALSQQKNILFIAVDDLRPDLGAYGADYIVSPHIDSLASKSILFERAYCQVAVCSPSRASLLTGRRPDTNHVWRVSDDEYWRTVPDTTNATSIPQYFKDNGYISIGMGKIFHPGAAGGDNDLLYSWSPEGLPYFEPFDGRNTRVANSTPWYSFDLNDNQLADGMTADNAVNVLQQLKQNQTNRNENRPFFLAVGLSKPHLPFYCPKRYYDLYPSVEDIRLPENPDPPTDMPEISWSIWQELRSYNSLEDVNLPVCRRRATASISSSNCRLSTNTTKELRRGYYACVSYIDAQVGRIMSELERQGFANDTIIVLWGDHGWQLGEHNLWAKSTNFETATRVPLMIRVPGLTDQGITTKALVELIDIFPSLTELAGIKTPPMCTEGSRTTSIACVEGSSIRPLIDDPNREWKTGAFSQFPRPAAGLSVITGRPDFDPNESSESVMGYSVRVDNYRFTEWYRFNRTISQPNFNDVWGTELYNHTSETTFFNDENTNLAFRPEMAGVVQELRSLLQSGWRAALPASSNTSASITPSPTSSTMMMSSSSVAPVNTNPSVGSVSVTSSVPSLFIVTLMMTFVISCTLL